MADEENTTTEEIVDTSTDEVTETEDLESDETSFEDVEDTDEAEVSEDEIGELPEEDTEPAEEKKEDVAEETEEVEETSEEPEAKETEDSTPPEDVKKHNQEMAAKRIADRQAREKAKEEAQAKYLESAEDDTQLAVRQLQIDAYNNLVEKNTNKLDNDMQKAVANIDLLRDGSPEVKEELLRRAGDFEARYVQYDRNGDPIKVKGSLYDFLQTEADSIQRILNTGAAQQVKAKTKAKARTETLPTRAPKEPKVDPDLQAFDEEVAKWE